MKRTAQFEQAKSEIVKHGTAVFIAAEKRAGIFKPDEYVRKHPMPFPFLLDEDRTVTKAYGIYHRLSVDAINIARPACIVVGKDRVIRYMYVGSSQYDRAPVDEMIAALAASK